LSVVEVCDWLVTGAAAAGFATGAGCATAGAGFAAVPLPTRALVK
jgi:hypothetical protein